MRKARHRLGHTRRHLSASRKPGRLGVPRFHTARFPPPLRAPAAVPLVSAPLTFCGRIRNRPRRAAALLSRTMAGRGKSISPTDTPVTASHRTRRQTRSFTGPRPHRPLNLYAAGRGRLEPLPSPSSPGDANPDGSPVDRNPAASFNSGPVTRAAARRRAAACDGEPGIRRGGDSADDVSGGGTRPTDAPATRGKGKKAARQADAAVHSVAPSTGGRASSLDKSKKVEKPAAASMPSVAPPPVRRASSRGKSQKEAQPAAAAVPSVAPTTRSRASSRGKGKKAALPASLARESADVERLVARDKVEKAIVMEPFVRTSGPVTRSVTLRRVASSAGKPLGSSSPAASGPFVGHNADGAAVAPGFSPPPRGPGPGGRTPKALRDLAGAAGANFMAQWTPSSPSPSPAQLARRRRASTRRRQSDADARSGAPLVALPQISTDPDTWSPPPTRDSRRLAEYSRRLAVLPAEDSSTDDDGAARRMRRGVGADTIGGNSAAGAPSHGPAAGVAATPPPVAAEQPALSPGVAQRLAVVVAAHERAVRDAAEVKKERVGAPSAAPAAHGPAATTAVAADEITAQAPAERKGFKQEQAVGEHSPTPAKHAAVAPAADAARNSAVPAPAPIKEVKQEPAVRRLSTVRAIQAPVAAATEAGRSVAEQALAAPLVARPPLQPSLSADGDTSVGGAMARGSRRKRPPRRHRGA